MKKYDIRYFCHISKMSANKTISAENKVQAKKKFKESFHVAPAILDVTEIKTN